MGSMVQKTTEWWLKVLQEPARLNAWLVRLYHNEKDAEQRFRDFAEAFCQGDEGAWHLFVFISLHEKRHAGIVADVLTARGIFERGKLTGTERYWGQVLPCVIDQSTAAGVGALAEGLSLERMRVIIRCRETPEDLRAMFEKIEPETKASTPKFWPTWPDNTASKK